MSASEVVSDGDFEVESPPTSGRTEIDDQLTNYLDDDQIAVSAEPKPERNSKSNPRKFRTIPPEKQRPPLLKQPTESDIDYDSGAAMPRSPDLVKMDTDSQLKIGAMISPKKDVPMESTTMFPVNGKGPAIGADPPALNLSRPASDDGYGRDDEKQSVLEETEWTETAGNGPQGMQQMVGRRQESAAQRAEHEKEGCAAFVGFLADVEMCICAPLDKIMGNSPNQQEAGSSRTSFFGGDHEREPDRQDSWRQH